MLLGLLLIYVGIGLAVGFGFVTLGVSRVDPSAAGSPIGFRLLILPGCVGLWPLILVMWFGARRGRAT